MFTRFLAISALLVVYTLSAVADNAALVVIDMQNYFAERFGYHEKPENQAKLESVIQRQVELIRQAKKSQIPIILVEYAACGPTCARLTEAIGDYSYTRTVIKSTDGLFVKRGGALRPVQKFLKAHEVTDLIVTGANGGACVRCSIDGAIENGYTVWTDERAIADFNNSDFVYPYRYGERTLANWKRGKQIQVNNFQNFDDILNAAEIKNTKPPSRLHCIMNKVRWILL